MQTDLLVNSAIQGTPEWLQERLGKATGSRFHDVCLKIRTGEAAGRKNYRYQLIAERLTGSSPESYKSSAMQWGNDHEASARLAYEFKTGYTVDESGLINHSELMAAVSPDGLVGQDGSIEIKSPNTSTHIETLYKKKVPYEYLEQVDGLLWVTGRKWCDFISYDPRLPEGLDLIIIRVERDELRIQDLADEVEQFLHEVDIELLNVLDLKEKK